MDMDQTGKETIRKEQKSHDNSLKLTNSESDENGIRKEMKRKLCEETKNDEICQQDAEDSTPSKLQRKSDYIEISTVYTSNEEKHEFTNEENEKGSSILTDSDGSDGSPTVNSDKNIIKSVHITIQEDTLSEDVIVTVNSKENGNGDMTHDSDVVGCMGENEEINEDQCSTEPVTNMEQTTETLGDIKLLPDNKDKVSGNREQDSDDVEYPEEDKSETKEDKGSADTPTTIVEQTDDAKKDTLLVTDDDRKVSGSTGNDSENVEFLELNSDKAKEVQYLYLRDTSTIKEEQTTENKPDIKPDNKDKVSGNREQDSDDVEYPEEDKSETKEDKGSADTPTTVEEQTDEAKKERSVFRLLKENEDDTSDLTAKSLWANVSVEQHVRSGSSEGAKSRYISTCKTYDAVRNFLSIKRRGDTSNVRIVKINLDLVDNEIIDLTDPNTLSRYISDYRARSFATKFQEILIRNRVPLEAYEVIYRGSKSGCPYSEPE